MSTQDSAIDLLHEMGRKLQEVAPEVWQAMVFQTQIEYQLTVIMLTITLVLSGCGAAWAARGLMEYGDHPIYVIPIILCTVTFLICVLVLILEGPRLVAGILHPDAATILRLMEGHR